MKSKEDRGVRPESLTNHLRALAKQKPRKRPQPLLEPVSTRECVVPEASCSSVNSIDILICMLA